MNKKHIIILTIISLIILFIGVLIGLLIGISLKDNKKDTQINVDNTIHSDTYTSNNNNVYTQTFYAKIKEIYDNSLLVEGIDVNDINYRKKSFILEIKNTFITWRGINIDISNLDVNDNISVTFDYHIQETDPGVIPNVLRIQLLDDKEF